MTTERIRTAGTLLLAALAAPAAAVPQLSDADLLDMSLEELGNVEVTSVSRRVERLADAPASVFVITAEDLRRSGVTTVPEALRLAPNLQVARISASTYAISARGFNNSTGNKLQVLLDGRILYTPLFSGVFWDVQDVVLEDVERIEVISGPAGTLWGSNAVNGVINIRTRHASETQGALVAAHAGNDKHGGALRYGGTFGTGTYRVYGKAFDMDATATANDTTRNDEWHRLLVGFRMDWGDFEDGVAIAGDGYRGFSDTAFPTDLAFHGGNLRARWSRKLEHGGYELRAYTDYSARRIPNSITERLNVYDVSLQHNWDGFERHQITWGIGHRAIRDHVTNAPSIAFLPGDRNLHYTDLYAQDEFRWSDALRVIAGVRVEDNTYTGVEVMPSVRLAYKPGDAGLWWGALSRAVRTPSRLDRELFAPAQPPFLLAGGPGFDSEESLVAEVGYRAEPSPRTSFSVTVFHHDYDELRSVERDASGTLTLGNGMKGEGDGVEAWGSVQVTDAWRLSAGLLLLDQRLRFERDSTDTNLAAAGNDPSNQWFLRSAWEINDELSLDASVRHVGELPSPKVGAYTALDMRFAWRPRSDLELALVGTDLADPTHPEFGTRATGSEIDRAWWVSVRWDFE